jgi:hypothetical protein
MFRGIEDQQQRNVLQFFAQRREAVDAIGQRQTERERDRGRDVLHVVHGTERHPRDGAAGLGSLAREDLLRQPRLADARDADDRHEVRALQQLLHIAHFAAAAHERTHAIGPHAARNREPRGSARRSNRRR